mgnify:CR=1 FL=1
MKVTPSPILLFTYNRPAHTKRLIESLKANSLAKDSVLYIYSDGPVDSLDKRAVDEVRSFLDTIEGFYQVTIIKREENVGLAYNIIDGVSTRVKEHGRVIVLEDDLIVAPHFLEFMNEALEVYKDETRVGHIQACDFINSPQLPETFLIRWTGSWGWATWERAWRFFNPNGEQLLQTLKERRLTKYFDFNGAYGFTKMLHKQIRGENNSWAIRWNASLFLADMLSLNVGRSLVQNRGFDGSGTHCGSQEIYGTELFQGRIAVKRITPIEENKEARKIFENYYRKTNSLWAKGVRRLVGIYQLLVKK